MEKKTGAERVRAHRARRRNHGMVEVRVWVKATDKEAALQALEPFRKTCRRYMEICGSHGYERVEDIPEWARWRFWEVG